MSIVSTFLKKRREKKLEEYYNRYQHYYSLYKATKNHVVLYRRPTPIWMGQNSHLTSIKKESENYLKQYRYWLKKFKILNRKIKLSQ